MTEQNEQNTIYECTGTVESIVFRNEDNGYTVLELSGEEPVTAVGIMPMIQVGEEVRLLGSFKNHPSYGKQFSVSACERSLPQNCSGILKYLSSGAVKGIGPSTAQRLVKAFGENTLEVLEKEPERVSRLKGITLEKAEKISEQIKQGMGIRELLLYLSRYDISPHSALLVYKALGSGAVDAIEANPYILCSGGFRISFETADRIARMQNRPPDDVCRLRAGISHVLIHNMQNGHTCLPREKLIEVSCTLLSAEGEVCSRTLEQMLEDAALSCEEIGGKPFVFTPEAHRCEHYIAARIEMLHRFPADRITDIDGRIEQIEKAEQITYAEMQKLAVTEALNKGILVLTGGPGTGKTTTLNAIIKILKDCGKKVFLAAPTGRAAQRMSAVTGCEAKTIHRLLEVNFTKEEDLAFKHNEKNLLDCDALIVDEVSMVDVFLFESLIRALPLGCRLILVGDSNQLPSVGPGNVLADLTASGAVPVVALNEIFRQSLESLIVTNAHRIISGELPVLDQKDKDFFFLPVSGQKQAAQLIADLCARRLPRSYGYSPFSDIQVLSPSKKGELGTENLNEKLQEILNPKTEDSEELSVNGRNFRTGDKVMQIKNNYNIAWYRENGEIGQGVFNGDIGILKSVNRKQNILKVDFDGRTAVYDRDAAADLDFAYACTVHKSQGNEFEAVVLPLHMGSPKLYYRNLLYTAVTRAKKLLILTGDLRTIEFMVRNNRRSRRYSGLKAFLERSGDEDS